MNRTTLLLVSLAAICMVHSGGSYASSNPDATACHYGIDGDRGRVASISDPAKKTEATGHLKAAYADELAGKFTDCLRADPKSS
jgi:hypothetical protein